MNEEIPSSKAIGDAEIELQHLDQVPAIDRERLFQAVRQSGEAISTDPQGFIEYANPTFERIAGYSLQEAVGEKEKLERQYLQAQKMEAIGRLSGGVAHDFNNMLGVIIGHAEMALEKLQSQESPADDLRGILTAAEKSAEIVRQLLTFARQQPIDPKVVDLNTVITGMLKLLRRLVGEDVDLVWLPARTLWPVKIDPSQVDQLLTNLCVNARDAIAGVGKITIETATTLLDEEQCIQHKFLVPGEYVVLTVTDNGCGIAGELLQDIFEPFFTTKGPGRGTGLGLATVYGIVKQNRGNIIVNSRQGHGTTFTIYLPRHHAALSLSPAGKKVERGKRGETVLLVEDDGELLLVARRMLEQLGYQVLVAKTPSEALAIAQNGEAAIHLLLTDVIMPEMNGRDLFRQLQTFSAAPRCLYMSGYTADVIARHGVLDAEITFIQKPFSKKELAKKIRGVLDAD